MSDPNILMRKIKKREKVKSEKLKIKNALNGTTNDEPKKSSDQMTKRKKSQQDEAPTKKKLKKKIIKAPETESDNEKEEEENEEEEEKKEDSVDEETIEKESNKNDNVEQAEDDASKKLPGSSIGFDISANATFSSLEGKVSEGTLKAIEEMGFKNMTKIQAKSLPPLLEGRDICGAAKTGSGKTLAFLIPAIELIVKLKFMPRNGTGCIVLSPTRELAMQTFGVLKELMKYHYNTYGLLMGGTSRQTEAQKLAKGINIIVVTPGRLLDHLQNTQDFLFKNLQCLIIDEADRMLADGFEEELKQIINILPKRRQTMLFSATQTKKTESLTSLALKKEPIYVGVDDEEEKATVDGLEQGYVICPSDKRFLLLFTFLKKNRKRKIMVFFSSCMSVKYHHELLNYIDLPVMSIHGKQKQTKRTTTFYQFGDKTSGILLCTDVAARGLDIPDVDWIVQYDPPDDPKEYIHRVGRTARAGSKGHALLILRPEEVGFLRYLKAARVPVNEFELSWNKVSNIQPQIEQYVMKNYFLNQSAKEAFKAYVRAYDSHHLKQIFNVETLDLNEVGKSFGFSVPPAINLRVGTNPVSRQKNRAAGGGYGYNKNANNGRQKDNGRNFRQGGRRNNDSRQFSR